MRSDVYSDLIMFIEEASFIASHCVKLYGLVMLCGYLYY